MGRCRCENCWLAMKHKLREYEKNSPSYIEWMKEKRDKDE